MSQEDKRKLPEQVKEKAARVKRHVVENKTTYLVGAGCAVAGASVASLVVVNHFGRFPLEINQTAKNTALIVWKPKIEQIALVRKACPDPIPVLDKATGIPYPSIRRAAAATGRNIMDISKDAQGEQKFFERLSDSVFA